MMRGPACFECGLPADHDHHVVPVSLGGTKTVPMCARHHAAAHGLDERTWTDHRRLTKSAIEHKRARGERTGSVPYGYRIAADGRTLEADPAEARAVALARELRAEGLTLRAIGARLEVAGYRARGGGRWHPDTVARLVAREFA